MGETRREGERKRTLAAGADEPERHRASRRLYPSGAESGGTRWDRVGREGMKNPKKIKGMVGNGASCFRFFHPLGQGSNPFSRSRMKSGGRNPP